MTQITFVANLTAFSFALNFFIRLSYHNDRIEVFPLAQATFDMKRLITFVNLEEIRLKLQQQIDSSHIVCS